MSIADIDDYEVAVNPTGELLFLLPVLEGKCEKPCLYYDGGAHAVLMRAPDTYALLRQIPEALRVRLSFATRISIQETAEEGASPPPYSATVHFAHTIPALQGIA